MMDFICIQLPVAPPARPLVKNALVHPNASPVTIMSMLWQMASVFAMRIA
jgi:hypothetical protein